MFLGPTLSRSVGDPDQPYRYLEVRGVLEHFEPDPDGDFFRALSRRCGAETTGRRTPPSG
jgi:hypothetical protein